MKNLQKLMTKAFDEVLSISVDKKVDLRTAAMMIGVARGCKRQEIKRTLSLNLSEQNL